MARSRDGCFLATYQTDGLDEGETQNGVGEELTTERWVAGDGVQEGSEDETDPDTGLEYVD
ncbi:hypothetical protein Tdes44962_MAKER09419 [Teratosphaeria destructans]|uniref:Uncharacterized protein n=1 Tax=Teratosphaeria destructans TaxID=418781 RepID=A0A9W7STJ9_9PEZI|nr:hypothetical protein Tdes44962_MAKER09419 [Teratosphaeria destructans]